MKLSMMIVLSLILTGCAVTKRVVLENDCPDFPELLTLNEEMWEATPPHVRGVVNENYIRLIDWGELMENRANCNLELSLDN